MLIHFVLSSTQVAVCNLASIALNMYVTSERSFDFKKLASVTKVIVKNLNKIIDINYYPVIEVRSESDHLLPKYLCWTIICHGGWCITPHRDCM